MTAAELQSSSSDYVSFGSHALSHRPLTSLDPADRWREISESAASCAALTGTTPTSFAYPFGDYDRETADMVRDAGFACACTTENAFAVKKTSPLHDPPDPGRRLGTLAHGPGIGRPMKWPKLVRRIRGAAAMRLGRVSTMRPLSTDFGFSRGTPIDRYYIEQFLQAHSADIRGDTLEVGDDSYSRRFGRRPDRPSGCPACRTEIRRRDHSATSRTQGLCRHDFRLHHPDSNAPADHGCRSRRSAAPGGAKTGRHLARHRPWRLLRRPVSVGRTLVLVHDRTRASNNARERIWHERCEHEDVRQFVCRDRIPSWCVSRGHREDAPRPG